MDMPHDHADRAHVHLSSGHSHHDHDHDCKRESSQTQTTVDSSLSTLDHDADAIYLVQAGPALASFSTLEQLASLDCIAIPSVGDVYPQRLTCVYFDATDQRIFGPPIYLLVASLRL